MSRNEHKSWNLQLVIVGQGFWNIRSHILRQIDNAEIFTSEPSQGIDRLLSFLHWKGLKTNQLKWENGVAIPHDSNLVASLVHKSVASFL